MTAPRRSLERSAFSWNRLVPNAPHREERRASGASRTTRGALHGLAPRPSSFNSPASRAAQDEGRVAQLQCALRRRRNRTRHVLDMDVRVDLRRVTFHRRDVKLRLAWVQLIHPRSRAGDLPSVRIVVVTWNVRSARPSKGAADDARVGAIGKTVDGAHARAGSSEAGPVPIRAPPVHHDFVVDDVVAGKPVLSVPVGRHRA